MSFEGLPKRYRQRLEKAIADSSFDVAQGRCTTFDSYKKLCGIIEGLQEALDMFDAEMKQEDEDEDD